MPMQPKAKQSKAEQSRTKQNKCSAMALQLDGLESIKSVGTGIVTGRELLLAQESLAPALVRPRDSRPGYQVQGLSSSDSAREAAQRASSTPRSHSKALASGESSVEGRKRRWIWALGGCRTQDWVFLLSSDG
ncbi:hypothetical protein V8C35DRAFT_288882 [Trichoderma chlorosporum]